MALGFPRSMSMFLMFESGIFEQKRGSDKQQKLDVDQDNLQVL